MNSSVIQIFPSTFSCNKRSGKGDHSVVLIYDAPSFDSRLMGMWQLFLMASMMIRVVECQDDAVVDQDTQCHFVTASWRIQSVLEALVMAKGEKGGFVLESGDETEWNKELDFGKSQRSCSCQYRVDAFSFLERIQRFAVASLQYCRWTRICQEVMVKGRIAKTIWTLARRY